MNYAVDEEIIKSNPVSGITKRLGLNATKNIEIEPLNDREVQLFLDTCRIFYREYYSFFFCAFRTGMRLGELLALHWGDVDWNRKFIRIGRSYKRGRLQSTKTGRIRHVDMSEQLYHTLKEHLLIRKKRSFQNGTGGDVEIIFQRNGRYMEQNFIRGIFKRILQKAGIRAIRIHDIRHTYASLLLSHGKSPVYVKEQLGHSSIQMTVDIYGRWISSGDGSEVDILDGAPVDTLFAPGQNRKTATD